MFVVDSECMRKMDAATIAAGTEGLVLMERAGSGAARCLLERSSWLWGTTLIVCGKGNNGGDGLVVARILHGRGHAVEVLLAGKASDLKGDAATNLQRAITAQVPIAELGEEPGAALRRRARERPGRLVVDAVLGTGFSPPLREPWGDLVGAMNDLGRRVVAMDCPSGLDSTTGDVDPRCVVADLTVTFGFPKWGFYLGEGRRHCGRIERIDLEFPRDITERLAGESPTAALYVDSMLAGGWWQPRPIDAHKYSVGSVLAVGGSAGMSGAMTLACLAAYRSGCGLVEAAVPGGQRVAIDTNCIEALVHALPETESGSLAYEGRERILSLAARHRAVLLGPGGGADLETARLFVDLMESIEAPLVVDADALNALSRLQRTPGFDQPCVLTPHSGELARLLGKSSAEIAADRPAILRDVAREWNAVILHKGAPTMVAAVDGSLAVIGSGGPGLATAGSGDVLAGALAALLAAGLPAFEAACLGAYLHGRAGDLAEAAYGPAGVLARDLVDLMAKAGHAIQERHR
jgi:NAD(P)H-hydrate epimerase